METSSAEEEEEIMQRNKLYKLLNNLHAGFLIFTLLFGLIAFRAKIRSLMYTTGGMFVFSGLWTYASYLYFGKGPISGASEAKGTFAIVMTVFEGTIILGFGLYILIHL